jgi:hypothetical protein
MGVILIMARAGCSGQHGHDRQGNVAVVCDQRQAGSAAKWGTGGVGGWEQCMVRHIMHVAYGTTPTHTWLICMRVRYGFMGSSTRYGSCVPTTSLSDRPLSSLHRTAALTALAARKVALHCTGSRGCRMYRLLTALRIDSSLYTLAA